MAVFQRARSEEQREARRQAILGAAAAMLAEMPVAEITLNELSRRVGLAKSNVLRYFESREAVLLESEADDIRGRGRVEYTTRVVEPVEAYFYRPLRVAALTLARLAKRLQSGRLEAYVAYMLFALVVALAITAGFR